MILKRFSHLLLVLALIVATILSPVQKSALAQSQAQTAAAAGTQNTAPDISARLAAIEKAIEEKRKEYHIPGISLVIVKDDKVIYMKGLGLKDVERNLPVTPDTLFAIGSSSKAFTAMAAAMSADDGKLSLDDSPKKFLPYFKLRDPETDAKITIRDLLSHRSGIDRTDLSMVSGSPLGADAMEIIWSNIVGKPQTNVARSDAPAGDLAREVGKYLLAEASITFDVEMKDGPTVEVTIKDDHVVMIVPGQPAYPLVEKEKDKLSVPSLPDTYSVAVKRDATGKVSSLLMKQPEGEFELTRAAERRISLTVDELITRMIEANGGEENRR